MKGGDERKATIVSSLLNDVNSAIGVPIRSGDDLAARLSLWLEEKAAVLGDALEEYGYPTLHADFREWLHTYVSMPLSLSMPRWRSIFNRIESAARELARGEHEIRDPNSSGQGYAPSHVDTPFHKTLLENSFNYSHSTRIWLPYYGQGGVTDTRRGPEYVLRHTYRDRSGIGAVGVEIDREGGPVWEARLIGGSARTRGTTTEELRRHLRAAAARKQLGGQRRGKGSR